MLRIDYIRVPGTQWVKDPDRRFDTVEIRAPLIRAIQRTRIAILDDLPKAFSLPAGEVQGKEIAELPDRVVREVVANAVMHRDYRVHGSIQVIRYANRLEVRNPGFSIKAQERLGEPGSQARNPKIAAILHEVKFAETKGSGIRVMRDLMTEHDLSAPYLKSDRVDNSFLAILLFHHFLSSEDIDWLSSFESYDLTDGEKRAMISAREVGAIDNSTYRTLVREDDTLSASKHLRRLCDHGLLNKKGSGPKTYYEPTAKALATWRPTATNESKSRELDSKSRDLPPDLQQIVDSLGSKAPPNRVLQAIVALLRWQDLTVAQLSQYLSRTPDHVRRTYLKELIKAGIVELSSPEKPNNPNQAYRAVRQKRKEAD